MKKITIFFILAIATISLTGCNTQTVKLDLKKVEQELDTLQSDAFSRHGVLEIIEAQENPMMKELEDVYDNEFEQLFHLDAENIEEYTVRYNKETKNMYMILLPKENKKETVQKEMDSYRKGLKNQTTAGEEYQDYLLYVVGENADAVIEAMKKSKDLVFGTMVEVKKEDMKQQFNVDPKNIEEALIKMPMMIVNSNTYFIIKPAKGKLDTVKKEMDAYMLKLEEQWKTYLPDQFELVKNRSVKEYGDYLIYIVSKENDLVFKTIQKHNTEA